jgi:uncharacterized membrane protein (DUF2068 family)
VVLDVALGVLILLAEAATVMGRVLLSGMYPQIRGGVALSVTSVLVSVVIAMVDFVLAYGIWKGKKWAWYFSLPFSGLGIALAVFALFARPRTGEFILLVIDLVILYLLMQPGVQQYFAEGSKRLPTGGMQLTKPGVV